MVRLRMSRSERAYSALIPWRPEELEGDEGSVGTVEGAVAAVGLAGVERLGPGVVGPPEQLQAVREGLADGDDHGVVPGIEHRVPGSDGAGGRIFAIGIDGLGEVRSHARCRVGVLVGVCGGDRVGVYVGVDVDGEMRGAVTDVADRKGGAERKLLLDGEVVGLRSGLVKLGSWPRMVMVPVGMAARPVEVMGAPVTGLVGEGPGGGKIGTPPVGE